jgi:hypothetical protein
MFLLCIENSYTFPSQFLDFFGYCFPASAPPHIPGCAPISHIPTTRADAPELYNPIMDRSWLVKAHPWLFVYLAGVFRATGFMLIVYAATVTGARGCSPVDCFLFFLICI